MRKKRLQTLRKQLLLKKKSSNLKTCILLGFHSGYLQDLVLLLTCQFFHISKWHQIYFKPNTVLIKLQQENCLVCLIWYRLSQALSWDSPSTELAEEDLLLLFLQLFWLLLIPFRCCSQHVTSAITRCTHLCSQELDTQSTPRPSGVPCHMLFRHIQSALLLEFVLPSRILAWQLHQQLSAISKTKLEDTTGFASFLYALMLLGSCLIVVCIMLILSTWTAFSTKSM
jgi:hypothetical protein